jgi:hypothetical protein
MLHDVLRRTVGHEMTERNVAQPQRNKRNDVAQRARRDRASHIGLRLHQRVRLHLRLRLRLRRGLGLCALLGLGFGCANKASRPDGGAMDGGASDASDAAKSRCPIDCKAIGLACSLQRCTSAACQSSETTGEGIAGCLFYTLQADNVTADENATTSLLVANAGQARADVTFEAAPPAPDGSGWTQLGEFQINVGASLRIPVPSGYRVTAAGVTRKMALRISSDQPVTVSQIESDNVDSPATSSGGTMILPLQSLGWDHRVITYAQEPTNDVQTTAGSRGGSARVMVVGTRDATVVTFSVVGPVTADPSGDPPDIPAGGSYQVTLDDGDVFQIYSGAMGEDLTGARVFSATAPVAVFAGNISTTYGLNVTGINSADMAHEQMPPVTSWSKSYVAAAMTPQASIGCTSFFGMDGASIWRVLAAHDGTRVTVAGPGIPQVGYPPLDAGAVLTLIERGSFTVTGNYPILVTQGIDCEPSLSLAMAVGATTLLTSLPFAVPPSFDLLLEIVRPSGAEIDLDGTAVDGAMFKAVGPGFEVASIPLDPCIPTDGSGVCTHLLVSSSKDGGFGMSLRGMDVGSSFAFTTPLVGCDPCLN